MVAILELNYAKVVVKKVEADNYILCGCVGAVDDPPEVSTSVISARRTIVIPKIAIDRIAFDNDVCCPFEIDGILGVEPNYIVSDDNTLVAEACFRICAVDRLKLNTVLNFTPLQNIVLY